ncbi:MAG TPA: hypothetical protein VGL99_14760 [Chloroflexota bacterium]
MLQSRARGPQRPLLASYPPRVRRIFAWYDALSDGQRVRYALIAIVFLLACAGYLLGLGSTVLLQRVEAEDALMAAQRLLTPVPTTEPTAEVILGPVEVPTSPPPTGTPAPRPTASPPPRTATPTPFSGPQITEKPAVPRNVPVNPPPRAPAVSVTSPTAKPRNIENATPIVTPAARTATPAAIIVRTPTVRPGLPAPTSATPRTPAATAQATPLPTLRLPATPAATAAPTPNRTPAPPAPTATPGRTPAPVR